MIQNYYLVQIRNFRKLILCISIKIAVICQFPPFKGSSNLSLNCSFVWNSKEFLYEF
nr:MAG TPA: hypothetical protein [Caudoviricetes sp.]